MGKLDSEQIIEEAHQNASGDRRRLEEVCKTVREIVSSPNSDDSLKLAAVEPMTRLTDSMARINLQLIELAKIRLKQNRKADEDDEDSDAMFDEIGDEFSRENEEETN